MKTKEQLAEEIMQEIAHIRKEGKDLFLTDRIAAAHKVAISNLYIALSNLTK